MDALLVYFILLLIFSFIFSGLLIKHQLVTHLALGIALRGVLDALRKSIDSKANNRLMKLLYLCFLESTLSYKFLFADVYVWYKSFGAVHGSFGGMATILQSYFADISFAQHTF